MKDQFLRRKSQQMNKNDRSLKRQWDERIMELCNKINESHDYYTTSSCSGRIILLKDIREKREDVIIKMWHDEISADDLKQALLKIKEKGIVYFKQDPCILHASARTLEKAQKLHDIAKDSGWKRCGIISSGKRFIVEMNGTERLEFPILNNRDILVDDKFLNLIVKEANKKLDISWVKIKKFREKLNSLQGSLS